MSAYIRLLSIGLVLMAGIGHAIGVRAQGVTSEETARSVQRMLERLPYYGVFDYIVFRVDRGTVYLAGYSFEGRLKADAEMAAKRASGVDEVGNKIEVLPTSSNDDRIRWATFYRIYTDDFLSRYAPGGVFGVQRALEDERHFPGMQPVGRYPIHIIVKNGRTMLLGIVDNATDRQITEVRAREVTGVFEVENGLTVADGAKERGSR
jgi:osmotically-inducible protein OsmY